MLKYFFSFIILVHGLIHLMGFAKAYAYGNFTQLTKYISKPAGLVWLDTAILFIVAFVLYLLNNESWPYFAIAAVVISQILLLTVWKDARFGTIINILIACVAFVSLALDHFEMGFKADVKKHIAQNPLSKNDLLTEADIASMPAPVQRYIRYAGAVSKPKVKNMRIVFDGEMREKGKDFFKFNSVQYNFIDDPARLFFMKAKMYAVPVTGYHCYQYETAGMQIKLLGLFNMVNKRGLEMDKAETVTVFNDICLMAPASLIDKRIEWAAIDRLSAKATFTNGINKITATLYFNEQGQLINFISDDRYEINNMKQYSFSTPVRNYRLIDGRNVPTYGETVWHYPDGEFVYGRFTLKSIEYNLAGLKP